MALKPKEEIGAGFEVIVPAACAIQQAALEVWQGKDALVAAEQQALVHRARCNRAARLGEYNVAMERTGI